MMDRLIPLSALQHYVFCPRQCALIHNEQVWADNFLTAHGNQLHQRVDNGDPETRKGVRYERGIAVSASTLALTGKLDLLEFYKDSKSYIPVEYKRGKPKKDLSDEIQLCAQALCIEEMTDTTVSQGALWYWQTRKRTEINIDHALRQQTLTVIDAVKGLFEAGNTPKAVLFDGCKACSLKEHCFPELLTKDRSKPYLDHLYSMDDE